MAYGLLMTTGMRSVHTAILFLLLSFTRAASAQSAPAPVPAEAAPASAFPPAPAAQAEAPQGGRPQPAPVPQPPTSSPYYAYPLSQGAPAYAPWGPGPYYPPPAYGPPRDEANEDSNEHEHWYGWQTLIVDGASLAVMLGGAAAQSGGAAGVGAVGYAVGGPIVHFAHGRVGAGLGSAALRVGLPFAGAFIGLAAADCSNHSGEWFCGTGEAAAGLLIGGAAAIAIDSALLARETEEAPAPMPTFGVTPVVDPNRKLGAVAVSGRF